MSRVSRFAARDSGPAARVVGFMAHLRQNGFRLGVAETGLAFDALAVAGEPTTDVARPALKSVCSGSAEDIARFDDLFDAYWLNGGKVRQKAVPGRSDRAGETRHNRTSLEDGTAQTSSRGSPHAPDSDGDGEAIADGQAKRVASAIRNLMKKDLRELVSPEDIRAGEMAALRLGQALRDRRSRRRKAARRGTTIDIRRTLRLSIATAAEPLRLALRRRPDRPVRITALCDVSGSMLLYARPFLAFVAGLLRADPDSDAYLFHTRLVRITDALRDEDALRALNRVTLPADGIGGGSRIGCSLDHFARTYARRFVNGRSVVVILSDGYDSASPEAVGAALARLKKRGGRIIWLNPLKSWAGYEPITRGMAAALPYLDHFASAATLEDLAALEKELARL